MIAHGLSQLMIVQRFSNLPVIKTGIDKATDIYVRAKKSNKIIEWSMQTAETTITIVVDISTLPVVLFDGPVHLLDEILCKSLDMVEEAVPIIKEQPDKIYGKAMEVVHTVMEPVLKRADSVKEISKNYSTKAVESIDGVLTAADGIVDKYLPELSPDTVDENDGAVVAKSNPTGKTIQHLSRTSRKLRRRLTQRTLYEARALKEQGKNVVHVLLNFADMLARDPRQFVQEIKKVWSLLSEDEPENQEPPQNLEELIVMLNREGARRFVHVANFITYNTVKIPQYAHDFMSHALSICSDYINSMNLKSSGIKRQAEILKHAIHDIFEQFFILVKPLLPGNKSGSSASSNSQPAIEQESSNSQQSEDNKEQSENSNEEKSTSKESKKSNKSQSNEGDSKNENEANGSVVQTAN